MSPSESHFRCRAWCHQMNATLIVAGEVVACFVLLWYLCAVMLGVLRMRPQMRIAYRIAFQRRRSMAVAGLDVESLLLAAENGDAAAQTRAGIMYATGDDGCLRDDRKAFSFFEHAASSGFVEAQYFLGLSYEYGLGVKQDYGAAHECYEDAARNGHPSAQCNLGVLDLRGLAERIDWISASYWFLKAASTYKHQDAIHNLRWIIDRRDALPVNTANMICPYRDSAF